MSKLSRYAEILRIDNKNYLFNLNNGCLIELDKETLKELKREKECATGNLTLLNENMQTLKEYEFWVDDGFDERQAEINHLNYSISKYNNHKDSLKIDFALTNQCNFNCPYCFECNNLQKGIVDNKEILYNTAKNLKKYLEYKFQDGVKKLDIVFYGGEPTLERIFVCDYINQIISLAKKYDVTFKYVFITNGYLFSKEFIENLNSDYCKFIQITIDGEKDFHNQRRTNLAKVNTFDKIVENVNKLIENKFYVVIRLNVDKQNFESMYNFINKIDKYFNIKDYGKYLRFDIARVFGSDNSYNLFEFEGQKRILAKKLMELKLIKPRIESKNLTTFCIAESLSNDLVIDFKGNLYRCWNNVFDDKYVINTLEQLLKNNCDPYENSNVTLEFVEKLSLENINNKKCFECAYCKYCQGLCPTIRKNILNGQEMNIYKNNVCKKIIKERIVEAISNLEV